MLEKIYSELQEVKSEVKENSKRLTGVEGRLIDVEGRLTKIETKVENEVINKINVLFDGYVQNTEIIKRVEEKIDGLTDQVEKQELEIRVIKGGR